MIREENESPKEIVHTLKKWEKKWGLITFNKKEIETLFPDLRNKPFDMIIGNLVLLNRKFNKKGRIWVGKTSLNQYNVGDSLRFYRRKESLVCIKKESLKQKQSK